MDQIAYTSEDTDGIDQFFNGDLNSVVANSVDACVFVIRDRKIVFSNFASNELLTGNKLISPIGDVLSDFFSEDYRFVFDSGFSGLLNDDQGVSLKINAADGSVRDVQTTFRKVGDLRNEVIVIAKDVTEKNRSAWESVSREYLYDEIINNVTDGLVTFRSDGQIESFNRAAEVIFGLSQEETLKHNISFLFPQLNGESTLGQETTFKRQIEDWVRGGMVELTGCRKSRELVDLEMGVSKIQFQGHPMYAAILRDISDRKQGEKTLRESEKKYRRIIDTALEGFWFVDPDMRTIEVNAALCNMLGYEPEEMIGRSALDFMSLKSAEVIRGRVPSLDNSLTLSYKETMRAKGGRKVHTVFNSTPLVDDDGALIGLFAFVSDVTDEYRQEKALRESKSSLKAIIDNAPAMISLIDLDHKYVLVNEKFSANVDMSGKEIVNKTPFDIFSEVIANDHIRENENIVASREVIEVNREIERDGATRFELAVKFPICDELGAVSGVGAIITDVTEQRVLDQKMRENDRLSALGQLAGGVAHDFNNILMIIGGYTRLAMRDPELSSRSSEALENIVSATAKAAGLTKQLLAFGRRNHLEVKTVKIGPMLGEVKSMLVPLLGETVELSVSGMDMSDRISTDTALFTQAIVNLAINARHAISEHGKIDISVRRVELGEKETSGWDAQAGDFVEICVADNGSGMDAKTLSRIFEPFFTTKDQGQGTGLGLAMVYGFVNQSNGMITVESVVGEGTTFNLRLPVSESLLSTMPELAAKLELLGRGETILLAEDNDSLRDLVQMSLEEFGYHVIPAADGFEALEFEAAHEGKIDMLLSDVVMPNLGGIELCTAIRMSRPEIKIVLMSGYPARGETHTAKLPNDVPLLDKPIEPEILARAIRNELDRKSDQINKDMS